MLIEPFPCTVNDIFVSFHVFLCRPNSAVQSGYSHRRERSIEDINKDIETIWKELQEIDKITRTGSQVERYINNNNETVGI